MSATYHSKKAGRKGDLPGPVAAIVTVYTSIRLIMSGICWLAKKHGKNPYTECADAAWRLAVWLCVAVVCYPPRYAYERISVCFKEARASPLRTYMAVNGILLLVSFGLTMASVGLVFSDFAVAFAQISLNERYLSLTLLCCSLNIPTLMALARWALDQSVQAAVLRKDAAAVQSKGNATAMRRSMSTSSSLSSITSASAWASDDE